MADWYLLRAHDESGDVGVATEWEGKPPLGPWLLPDGRDIDELIADGRLDEVPFPVWFRRVGGGKRWGDLLPGGACKIASVRLVGVLESIGATGYRTFPIDLRDRGGEPITGYVGFATTPWQGGTDIQPLLGWQNFTFWANARVVEALRARGADDLVIEVYDPVEFGRPPAGLEAVQDMDWWPPALGPRVSQWLPQDPPLPSWAQ